MHVVTAHTARQGIMLCSGPCIKQNLAKQARIKMHALCVYVMCRILYTVEGVTVLFDIMFVCYIEDHVPCDGGGGGLLYYIMFVCYIQDHVPCGWGGEVVLYYIMFPVLFKIMHPVVGVVRLYYITLCFLLCPGSCTLWLER